MRLAERFVGCSVVPKFPEIPIQQVLDLDVALLLRIDSKYGRE